MRQWWLTCRKRKGGRHEGIFPERRLGALQVASHRLAFNGLAPRHLTSLRLFGLEIFEQLAVTQTAEDG